MTTRNGKQIRDRFLNYLDTNINKTKFNEEDDKKIIESYKLNGSKWSVIAKGFPGRTGDMIKNRFYSCLKKRVHMYEMLRPKLETKKYRYKQKKKAYLMHETQGQSHNDISLTTKLNSLSSFSTYNSAFKPFFTNKQNVEEINNEENMNYKLIKEDPIDHPSFLPTDDSHHPHFQLPLIPPQPQIYPYTNYFTNQNINQLLLLQHLLQTQTNHNPIMFRNVNKHCV